MDILEIKQRLSMDRVLHYYGLKADRNNLIKCPFHEDRTPSMQVYPKTGTAYCFSSNCKTHGKSMDVIDFVMYKENFSKAKAIEKSKEILGYTLPGSKKNHPVELIRKQFLGQMWQYFKNAVFNSPPAKEYLAKRGLDPKKLSAGGSPVGYNAAQFHHGVRRNEDLIARCLEHGLLLDKNQKGRTGEKAYSVFGKWCICFALKNKEEEVTGMYFRSIIDNKESKHYYLKNRQGLYPCYPNVNTKTLILTESIIDCASLLPIENLQSGVENLSFLACYGTNGLTDEHTEAIRGLKYLEEVIFMFDMDEAGRKATLKYAKDLRNHNPTLVISKVELPCKDVNETLQGHQPEVFTELLKNRKTIASTKLGNPETGKTIFLSNEEKKSLSPTSYSLSQVNELIGESGIIGEENTRLLLFIIASSYRTSSPLHAIVQGSSGSGKTHLISKIADLMPPQDVLRFTRITESSLYNWGQYDLVGKLMVIEDLDGLKEEALYALRELISSQRLSSSVSIKDKKGNIKSVTKEVWGVFSSLCATTKGDIYEDNISRSFVLAVDESSSQSQKIIAYQNRRYAGEVSKGQESEAKKKLQDYVRDLQDHPVVNPYATKLQLPREVHKIRRLNGMYQSIIRQVTWLNQRQRKLKDGKLLTDTEDLRAATEILFESILLKIDELDGSLRQFFERLKKYVKQKEQDFTQREVRQGLNISKSQLQRYINHLLELEYIRQSGGYINKGIRYRIDYWDDYEKLRKKVKQELLGQIESLEKG